MNEYATHTYIHVHISRKQCVVCVSAHLYYSKGGQRGLKSEKIEIACWRENEKCHCLSYLLLLCFTADSAQRFAVLRCFDFAAHNNFALLQFIMARSEEFNVAEKCSVSWVNYSWQHLNAHAVASSFTSMPCTGLRVCVRVRVCINASILFR